MAITCHLCRRKFQTIRHFTRHAVHHCAVRFNATSTHMRQTRLYTSMNGIDDLGNSVDTESIQALEPDIDFSLDPVISEQATYHSPEFDRDTMVEPPYSRPLNHGVGLLSTSSSIRVELYSDITERDAGGPIPMSLNEMSELGLLESGGSTAADLSINPSIYNPFDNAAGYALARWFFLEKCTKGAVNRFLQDKRLAPLHSHICFTNADEWLELLNKIPYGIVNDGWKTSAFTFTPTSIGRPLREYTVMYRCVIQAIRFLIGHKPFEKHLTYAPTRQFNSNDDQVFNEMHTGEWWWRTQTALPDNATLVPLLLSTDKTALTQHHGDKMAWPVYITIGNLSREYRRKQTSSGTILLGFLPVGADGGKDGIKNELYHTSMREILKPIETYAKQGFSARCADGQYRMCYPILAGFMVDYEEQVLITGVKSGQQCTVCEVPSKERENLCGTWPIRTHASTQAQIHRQEDGQVNPADETWVHPVLNFAWNHHLFNVHSGMMIDILHQLMKGLLQYLITWTQLALEDFYPNRRRNPNSTLLDAAGSIQLDDRFRQVPKFPGLKTFDHFSKVKQWTGEEQKAMMHQFIAVITPLLITRRPAIIHFARAVLDFAMMAHYRTHDEETLRYMDHALYRINKLKAVFKAYRPQDKATNEGHFNFPKFHAVSHYPHFIREFGCADGYNSSHSEAAHKFLVKAYYPRTNKREGFAEAIGIHNIRRVNILAMDDIIASRYASNKDLYMDDGESPTPVTSPARPKNLNILGIALTQGTQIRLERLRLSNQFWRDAMQISIYTNTADFIDALAAFIRTSRYKFDLTSNDTMDRISPDIRERDPSWAESYLVMLHGSLKCWKPTGHNPLDGDQMIKEAVRCAPDWQGKPEDWRRDHVWVQEYDTTTEQSVNTNGKLVGQLRLVVTILDHERRDTAGRHLRYTAALIDEMQLLNNGQPHKVHGMIEVEPSLESQAKNPKKLGHRRFYKMSNVIRSAHVVPAGKGRSYINNYIDWDQYNTLYDVDFINNGTRVADRVAREFA